MGLGWPTYTLGDLCRFKYGHMPRKTDLCDDGYPVFSGYRIVGHATTYHYEEPEIIVVARGVGGAGDIKMSPPRCFLTNLSIVAQVVSSEVDKKFLYYRLAGPKLWELRTGSAQAQITIDRLQRYELRLPPLPTQQKIATILSGYDDLMENNVRRIKILEEMAQNLYHEWFVKFRFPGHQHACFTDSLLGRIPQKWECGVVNDLVSLKSGFAFRSSTFIEDGTYGLVTIRNVHDGLFVPDCTNRIADLPSNMSDFCHLSTGDVLLSLTGNIGRVCLVYGTNYLLNQRVAKLVPNEVNNRAYVYLTFRQDEFQTKLSKIANGVAQQNLSPIETGKTQVVIPSQKVLADFAGICEPIVKEMTALFQENATLRRTRDLLLPRLISGEVDVSELDIAVPEEAMT